MGACPPDPDGSEPLTRHEQRVLRASDALLDVAMTDGARPLPRRMIRMGAALTLIPLVLLVPFAWWSAITAVAAATVAFSFRWRVAGGGA